MRLVLLLCFFTYIVFGEGLRIIGAVPFGASSLRLEANKNIKKDEISIHKLNENLSFIDVYGTLAFSKREYNFANKSSIVVVQNNKERLRILLNLTEKTSYNFQVVNKFIYVSIINKAKKDSKEEKKATKKADIKKEESKKIEVKKVEPKKVEAKKETIKKVEAKKAEVKKIEVKKANIKKVEVKKEAKKEEKKPMDEASKNAKPILMSKVSKSFNTNLSRELRKKIIILDPGHGGKDCGALGITNTCEKHIVLNVAKLAASVLAKEGYIVYLTRSKDVFIDLRRRTEMANELGADIFISIHANSMPKGVTKPNGVETYFLSTARSQRALSVAELENKGDVELMDYYSKSFFLNTLNSHRLIASNKLAIDMQFGVLHSIKTQYKDVSDGGVREGPFWVLAGALMPSILIEVGYNSNPKEASRLINKEYQKLIAEGIKDGVNGYFAKNR